MSVRCPSTWRIGRALVLCGGVAACWSTLARGAGRASLRADRGCYLVGQPVRLHGGGFAAGRAYIVTLDDVFFGQNTTDSSGSFAPRPILPGGLPAGYAQAVEHVEAQDGTRSASTTFTVTRRPGARFLAIVGSGNSLRAPIEVWGFAMDGSRTRVYMHYVASGGKLRATIALGQTTGQCGYLRTPARRVFPFAASPGRWTFQVDTQRIYVPHPSGPVRRITVVVH